MKCKIFIGEYYEAQNAFNKWAKGKTLTRDVVIHTVFVGYPQACMSPHIAIIVYHPEDPFWDATPEQTEKIKSYTTEETEEEKALKVTA
jgi:hypothetical protein